MRVVVEAVWWTKIGEREVCWELEGAKSLVTRQSWQSTISSLTPRKPSMKTKIRSVRGRAVIYNWLICRLRLVFFHPKPLLTLNFACYLQVGNSRTTSIQWWFSIRHNNQCTIIFHLYIILLPLPRAPQVFWAELNRVNCANCLSAEKLTCQSLGFRNLNGTRKVLTRRLPWDARSRHCSIGWAEAFVLWDWRWLTGADPPNLADFTR